MDLFHCGSLLGYNRPTTHHDVPQAVRDTVLWVLSIWSRWVLSLAYPRVNYRSVAGEVEKRHFFRDAFKHQHRE